MSSITAKKNSKRRQFASVLHHTILLVVWCFTVTNSPAEIPQESNWGKHQGIKILNNPDYLGTVHDEVNHVYVTRISDEAAFGVSDGAIQHQYAKVQAWNADMTMISLGFNTILDAHDYSIIKTMNISMNDARWSNVEPNIRYFGDGDFLKKVNVLTNKVTILHEFPGYKTCRIGPWEGNLSADDRYVVVTSENEKNAALYDIKNDVVLGEREFPGTFDWASITPWGDYVVVNDRGTGDTRMYDLKFNFVRILSNETSHADFAVDSTGNRVFVEMCPLRMVRMDNGKRTDLLPSTEFTFGICGDGAYNPWVCGHVSGRGLGLPGWALISAGIDQCKHGEDAYYNRTEIFLLKLDGSGTIRSLGFTRSTFGDYLSQAKAVLSPDGKKALFTSDWNIDGDGTSKARDYVVEFKDDGTGNPGDPDTLDLSEKSHVFLAKGGKHDISVTSNSSWNWSKNAHWITSTESNSQSKNQTFSYSVTENLFVFPRSGTITFTAGGIERMLTITQQGAAVVIAPTTPTESKPTNPASVNPITKGKYTGFISSASGAKILGYIQNLKLNSRGRFSGALYFENVKYRLKGEFDKNGFFKGSLIARGQSSASVELQFERSEGNAFQINGTITVKGIMGTLTTRSASHNPLNLGKTYTALVLGNKSDARTPQGNGYATVKINRNNSVRIKGILADGSKWTAKSMISSDAEFPIYARLYNDKGSIAGMVHFLNIAKVSDFDSELIWHKPNTLITRCTLIGSRYSYAKGRRLINHVDEASPNTKILIGSQIPVESWSLDWTSKNKLTYPSDKKLKVKIKLSTGIVKSSIPENTAHRHAGGVIFQKQNIVSGFSTLDGKDEKEFSIVPLTH